MGRVVRLCSAPSDVFEPPATLSFGEVLVLSVMGNNWEFGRLLPEKCWYLDRGVRGIFFRGGKVIFPEFFPSVKCFFSVENSHFGRPKTNFSGFFGAGKVLSSFYNFSSFHFQFSTFPFWIFLLFFSVFPFFLPSLFPVGQQKFPGEKYQGALCPPAPGCYATVSRGKLCILYN